MKTENRSATIQDIANAIDPAMLSVEDRLALIDLLDRCLAADRAAADRPGLYPLPSMVRRRNSSSSASVPKSRSEG